MNRQAMVAIATRKEIVEMTTETTERPIKAVLKRTNMGARFPCVLCDGTTEKESINAELVEPDQGFVCERCLAAGPEQVRARVLDKAASLESRARDLREAAEREFELPSHDEWVAAQQVNDESYFGVCPECGRSNGCINVGKGHWFHCREHKTKWFVGSNLFSSWRQETEEEQRERYEELDFGSYREVEPEETWFDPEHHTLDVPAALARYEAERERQEAAYRIPFDEDDIPF